MVHAYVHVCICIVLYQNKTMYNDHILLLILETRLYIVRKVHDLLDETNWLLLFFSTHCPYVDDASFRSCISSLKRL